MRIEDEAYSDVRFQVLATGCQLADSDHALGKMSRLWRQCTSQGTYVLSEATVRAVLGARAVESLVESGLGEVTGDGIRIRGTRGRIEWLKKLRNNAKKGGKAKAAKRQTGGRQEAARTLPTPFPPAPAPAPIPAPIPAPTNPEPEKSSASPPARAPSGPHQEAIAAFDAYYRDQNGGAKPTWNGRTAKLMATLVKAHGLDEVRRRLRVLAVTPPSFPPAPWDMGTLSQHFDKLAVAARNMTPIEQQLERVRVLEAQERGEHP